MDGKKSIVSVYGSGIKAPLLKSDDVRLIQIRDEKGELLSLFFKLTDTMWGFTTRGDSDWEEHKKNLEIDESRD